MKKLKFLVKGMHCQACATLIEIKLKDQPGVANVKVNNESEKAVVIYDEQKINKDALLRAVESAGDYKTEEIIETPTIEETAEDFKKKLPLVNANVNNAYPAKNYFVLGMMLSIMIISLIVNVFLASALLKKNSKNVALATGNQKNQPLNQPTQPTANNNPAIPAIQAFVITKDNHVRGNFNAPITLVEFSDFECPFCGRTYPTFKKILADYPNQVRLVYKQFPLTSIHQNSQKAAEASECASEQGKFWEYHDKLFDDQATGFSVDKFKTWATELNLDSNKFNNCLDSGKYASIVTADQQEGQTKGVNGTPATFVNGQLVAGAVPYENFKQIIDASL